MFGPPSVISSLGFPAFFLSPSALDLANTSPGLWPRLKHFSWPLFLSMLPLFCFCSSPKLLVTVSPFVISCSGSVPFQQCKQGQGSCLIHVPSPWQSAWSWVSSKFLGNKVNIHLVEIRITHDSCPSALMDRGGFHPQRC